MGLGGVAGATLLGMASDRRGRRPIMVFVLLGTSISLAIVALGHGWFVTGAVLVYSVVFSSFPPLVASYVRDHADARAFGSAFSTMTIFYSLLALAAPFIIGRFADRAGSFKGPFLILAAAALLGCWFLWGLPRIARRAATAD